MLATAVLVLAGACSAVAPVRYEAGDGVGTPVWPEPPAAARVRWEGAWNARSDGYVRPHGLDAAADGALCVADPPARLVWRHDPEGRIRRVGDGDLRQPVDCALLPDGALAVADSVLGRVFIFDARGRLRGASPENALERPVALAADPAAGRLFVADALGHRIVILGLDATPRGAFGHRGTGKGEFNFPVALELMPGGRLAVVDSMNFRVQIVTTDGTPVAVFGSAGDGPGTFSRPRGIAVDAQGHIWVADALFDNVQIFDQQGRLLLAVGRQGRGPGQFWMPAGIASRDDGRVFVADAYNRRVQVFALLAPGGTTP